MDSKLVRRPTTIAAAALAGGALVGLPRGRKLARAAGRRLARRGRWLPGAMHGVTYRLSGGHPDPNVPDDVLADRVRSSLGGLERRLDVPHVNVTCEDHVVLLHGEVPSEAEATAIEEAVVKVPGVRGVTSYLHIGLSTGGTRPSEGRAAAQPTEALARLLDAARAVGVPDGAAHAAVRGVLTTLADVLPAGDRDHLLSHLPADVVALAKAPRRLGRASGRVRHVDAFLARVCRAGAIEPTQAPTVTASVLGCLRRLVPEEAAHVAGVLPTELQRLWEGAVPAGVG